MDANLDLLLTVVYYIADDFLPKRAGNPRRKMSDPEIVALCLAQAIMGIPSDPRFLAVAAKRLVHLFPQPPARDAFHKRRLRLLNRPGFLGDSWPWRIKEGVHANGARSWEADDASVFA